MGEAEFGLTEGVLATKPGWIGRTEVVEVTYDPARIAFADLVKKGESCRIARTIFTRDEAQQARTTALVGKRAVRSDAPIRVQDDKYYLSRTPLKFVPMTPAQAMLVNARIGKRRAVDDLLSPCQKALLALARAKPDAGFQVVIGKGVVEAWAAQEKAMREASKPAD